MTVPARQSALCKADRSGHCQHRAQSRLWVAPLGRALTRPALATIASDRLSPSSRQTLRDDYHGQDQSLEDLQMLHASRSRSRRPGEDVVGERTCRSSNCIGPYTKVVLNQPPVHTSLFISKISRGLGERHCFTRILNHPTFIPTEYHEK